MASETISRSADNTLSGTTADTITFNQRWPAVEIHNHGSTALYVRMDGTAAVAEANGTTVVPAGATKILKSTVSGSDATGTVVSIVGDGNQYSIEGVQ